MSQNLTLIDTDEPSAALVAYWGSPEFKSYLEAKTAWEKAHAAYVGLAGKCGKTQWEAKMDGTKDRLARELTEAAAEARKRLEVCRALPVHKEAYGW